MLLVRMSRAVLCISHPGKAILPELDAYQDYFQSVLNLDVHIAVGWPRDIVPSLLWIFMGHALYFFKPRFPVVHEYASLSAGAFPKVKNMLKKHGTPRPHHRLFLNEFIRSEMNFRDHIPYTLRDMGVWKGYYQVARGNRNGRWFYAGAVSAARHMDRFLSWWCAQPDCPELLICGPTDPEILRCFSSKPSIRFLGHLHRAQLAEAASQAEFGLNLIPPCYPYLKQTCTKVLEYCAMGLKVISTRSEWLQDFSISRNMQYAPLNLDVPQKLSLLMDYPFSIPDVSDLEWSRVLDAAGLNVLVDRLLTIGLDG
jgi:hypothetical protein